MPPESLHELDRDEFFDAVRVLKPDLTREEYEIEWEMFQLFKLAQRAKEKLQ